MDISGSVALVTGANRGLGRVLAGQLLERGAETVYAAARDPRSIVDDRLVPVALDVTDPESVRRAAEACDDVTLLINNAGRAGAGSLLTADLDAVRGELRGQGTQVLGVHVGYMDTDMTARLDVPKVPPAGVAAQILDAVAAGEDEVLADELTRGVKQLLSGPPAALTPSR